MAGGTFFEKLYFYISYHFFFLVYGMVYVKVAQLTPLSPTLFVLEKTKAGPTVSSCTM